MDAVAAAELGGPAARTPHRAGDLQRRAAHSWPLLLRCAALQVAGVLTVLTVTGTVVVANVLYYGYLSTVHHSYNVDLQLDRLRWGQEHLERRMDSNTNSLKSLLESSTDSLKWRLESGIDSLKWRLDAARRGPPAELQFDPAPAAPALAAPPLAQGVDQGLAEKRFSEVQAGQWELALGQQELQAQLDRVEGDLRDIKGLWQALSGAAGLALLVQLQQGWRRERD